MHDRLCMVHRRCTPAVARSLRCAPSQVAGRGSTWTSVLLLVLVLLLLLLLLLLLQRSRHLGPRAQATRTQNKTDGANEAGGGSTWPREAAATGCSEMELNTAAMGRPRSCSIISNACSPHQTSALTHGVTGPARAHFRLSHPIAAPCSAVPGG